MSDPSSMRIPGRRIGGYRNARPRVATLLGLGSGGEEIVRSLLEAPEGFWRRHDPDARVDSGPVPEFLVLVHRSGDSYDGEPVRGTGPGQLATLVIIDDEAGTGSAPIETAIRRQAQLLVRTRDADFVRELLTNLAT